VATTITTLAESLARDASIDGISGIGISLGGQVVERATVRWGMFLDWEEVPLGDLLRERTDVPVVVANDLTALTEATHWFGAGRGVSRFCLLTIGAGIGYGLVAHDKLVDSGDASLGLIGHHPLIPGGPLCDRGHEGCASALLTTDAVVTQVGEVLGRAVGYEEALDLAAQGDEGARQVIDRAGFALGKLVAAAANFTLPERIVIGGEGVRLVEIAQDALLDGLHADRHPASTDPQLVLLDPDFSEWARGAAVIAIQTFVLGS
jgi:predicted NBD/HSP70 family sugar kinase